MDKYFTHTKAKKLDNLTILFLILAPMAVFMYAIFVFNPFNADFLPLYFFQVVADFIAIVVVMGLWLTILFDVFVPNHHNAHNVKFDLHFLNTNPTIDIFIPVAGEPLEVVERTVRAAKAIEYPHQVFILDDGRSEQLIELAKSVKVHYIQRSTRRHAKAGNINNGLQYSRAEFFAILDADMVAYPQFITNLPPYMVDSQMGMVQSPQHFENQDYFIARGTAEAQEIFYKHVCPGKNTSNSVFCVGTNMIFRRKAIDDIGGIAQLDHSEDIWTSLKLHEKGWKTLFVNEVLAVGHAPMTISSYFKQQLRWAKGGIGMLFMYSPLRNKNLSLDQRMQYFMSNSFFLVGIPMLAYLLFPVLYLLFGLKPLKTDSTIFWLLHYLPFFICYYTLTWLLLRKLHIATIATALASFYPYLLALWSTVMGSSRYVWVTTTSRKSSGDLYMKWVWPHYLLIFVTVISLVIAWIDPLNVWNTLYNSLWASWNLYLLVLFLYGNNRFIGER